MLGSGHEDGSRWANSRRSYNAGYGIKKLTDLQAVVAFFEERRGRLYGFRWKDWNDFKSCAHETAPSELDQDIGVGDGALATFQLVKTYGGAFAPYTRGDDQAGGEQRVGSGRRRLGDCGGGLC